MYRTLLSLILAIVFLGGLAAAPATTVADNTKKGGQHFSGRGLDIGRVDGQTTAPKQRPKALKVKAPKGKAAVSGEVFVKLPGRSH